MVILQVNILQIFRQKMQNVNYFIINFEDDLFL